MPHVKGLWRLALGAFVFLLSGFSGCLDRSVSKTNPEFVGAPNRLWAYVDTRFGTGGAPWVAGHTSPAAQLPQGLVRLGPDTAAFGRIYGTGGYQYSDTAILGFSHTRLSGTGVFEGGALRVLPTTDPLDAHSAVRASLPFAHRREVAVPGYYRVDSLRRAVQAELTATERVGFHRYRFHERANPSLTIDIASHLSRGGHVDDLDVTVDALNSVVTGKLTRFDGFSGRYGGLPTFFVIRLPPTFQSHRFFDDTGDLGGNTVTKAKGPLWLELRFAAAVDAPVEIQVALSHVSAAGAAQNLDTETATFTKTFDVARAEAHQRWQDTLATARVTEGPEVEQRLFYTTFYHSLAMPTRFDDRVIAGDPWGKYWGFDKAAHFADGFGYHTDLSLWDTFRTAHPLYGLLIPQLQKDVNRSLLAIAAQSGRLPRWAQGGGHTDSMFGAPAAIVLAESAAKALGGFDENVAFQVSKDALTPTVGKEGQECLEEYERLGYCPSDARSPAVSLTMEYSYADGAMAAWAARRGDAAAEKLFGDRSKNYRNLWQASRTAFVPKKRDGTFLTEFALTDTSYTALTASGKHFAEGSANHWRWYAPHDPIGLRDLFGDRFVPELTQFFERAPQSLASLYPPSFYWHGNEHDLHAAFLFLAADRSDLAQKWVRWIRTTKYAMNATGLDGNDDGGTLSAWYVLATLGLYPQAGFSRWYLVAPGFGRAELRPAGGALVVIEKSPADAPFACAATWNGAPVAKPEIEHAQLVAGGTLHFFGSTEPCVWRASP